MEFTEVICPECGNKVGLRGSMWACCGNGHTKCIEMVTQDELDKRKKEKEL